MTLVLTILSTLLASQWAFAFQRFQNDILIGSRAVGLGGAYSAVASDASALYYNPAGLASAKRSISLSVNGYYYRRNELKGFSFADDIKNISQGTVASFFGGVTEIKRFSSPLFLGFAIYIPHDEILDRTNKSSGLLFEEMNNIAITKVNSNTTHYAIGAAKQLGRQHHLGLGLTLIDYRYSDLTYASSRAGPLGDDDELQNFYISSNSSTNEVLNARMIELSLGHLWNFQPKWKIGFLVSVNSIVDFDYDKTTFNSSVTTDRDGNVSIPSSISQEELNGVLYVRENDKTGSDLELRKWPSRQRMGVSYKNGYSTYSFDVSHHTSTEATAFVGEREAVTNFHVGWEWSHEESHRYALGLFTNFDTQPSVIKSSSGDIKVEQLDQIGVALSAAATIFETDYQTSLVYQQGDSNVTDPLTQKNLKNRQYRVMAYLSVTN